MGIDFHDEKNRDTYAARQADRSWKEAVQALVPAVQLEKSADIGTGGGIYARALVELGAETVVGVDFSESNLQGAWEACADVPAISFIQGDAEGTGLPDSSFTLVLERALIHHLPALDTCFQEAYRLLEEDGMLFIQDRTPEDCLLPGSEEHIRGYFFERFPHLTGKETKRRHSSGEVREALAQAGFHSIREQSLWEIRKRYETKDQLLDDLRRRTGRSILHELSDQELNELTAYIDERLPDSAIIEKDRWTIWTAVKRKGDLS